MSIGIVQKRLRNVRAVLLDMDGVVYVGEQPLPGLNEFLDYMEETGRRWLCVTNNASKTPDMFVEKLARMGVNATPDHVLGSSQATAAWLAKQNPLVDGSRGKAIIVGMEGLRAALLEQQFELTEDLTEAEFAVVGIHFELTYEMLVNITLAIRNGARFIGTNSDSSFPSERGLLPGAGSILALIETATGVKPEVVGKPNAAMFEMAMQRLAVQPSETMMVGDRYETDIAGAIKLDITTVGVLTGINTRSDFEQANPPPDMILTGLPALLAEFKEADRM